MSTPIEMIKAISVPDPIPLTPDEYRKIIRKLEMDIEEACDELDEANGEILELEEKLAENPPEIWEILEDRLGPKVIAEINLALKIRMSRSFP